MRDLKLLIAAFRDLFHKDQIIPETQQLRTKFLVKTLEMSVPQETDINFVREISETISQRDKKAIRQIIFNDRNDIPVLRKLKQLLSKSDNK